MYGKLINGVLVLAPKIINAGDVDIYNPSPKTLMQNGYKEVVDTPYPETDDENPIIYVSHFEDREDKIIKIWEEAAEENDFGGTE